MDWAVQVYLDERAFEGEPEARHLHVGAGGWYSVEAMGYALRTTGMAQYGKDMFELHLWPLNEHPEDLFAG
eukprot:2363649-Prorocentrum_lima.AAC.1